MIVTDDLRRLGVMLIEISTYRAWVQYASGGDKMRNSGIVESMIQTRNSEVTEFRHYN